MIGLRAPRPAPARTCQACEDDRGRPPPAGSYYCFICDVVETEYCGRCWLHLWHGEHFGRAVEEECVRLRTAGGVYVNIPGDHADRYRPTAYVDLLERYEWDEERAPRSLVAHATEFGELLTLVQDVARQAEAIALDVYGPSDQIEDTLIRVLRSPRRLRTWRERLRAVRLVLDVLVSASGHAARVARARAIDGAPADAPSTSPGPVT